MSETAQFGRAIALLGYACLVFGLMFALAIANRHLFSPDERLRLPAFAAMFGAVTLGCLALVPPGWNLGWAVIQTAVFAALLWGLLDLARKVSDGQTGIAVAITLTAIGTVFVRAADYAR
ncbi:MAG: hypothetical protein OEN23_00740 [Paracoccaceae bacterium]|nr:hypothetical protein [Paracoccaceae bacterium]